MSGIYIPDVSLPGEGDFELWIAVKKDGSFTFNVRGEWNNGERKVIAVPDHGDLIDKEAVLHDLGRIVLPDDLSYTIGHDMAKRFIEKARVVVMGDEKE